MLCHHWAAFPGSNDTASMLKIGRPMIFCSWASWVSLLGDYSEEAGAHHFLIASAKEYHRGSAKTASIRRPFTYENEISCITEPHKITWKVLLQVIDFLWQQKWRQERFPKSLHVQARYIGANASQPLPAFDAVIFYGIQNKLQNKAISQCLWKAVLCFSRMAIQEGSGKTFSLSYRALINILHRGNCRKTVLFCSIAVKSRINNKSPIITAHKFFIMWMALR